MNNNFDFEKLKRIKNNFKTTIVERFYMNMSNIFNIFNIFISHKLN